MFSFSLVCFVVASSVVASSVVPPLFVDNIKNKIYGDKKQI